MSLKIDIRTIPHSEQRYETVGDWYDSDGTRCLRISSLGDWRMELGVAIHELVECYLCDYMDVSQAAVDDFDMAFEARRESGNIDEPGDDPLAPYHFQHCVATGVERIVIALLGVNWKEYDDKINAL